MIQFHPSEKQPSVGVVVVTGSCCFPGLAPLDHQVETMLDQIIAETGVPARVKAISVIQAISGGVAKEILTDAMDQFQQGRPSLPAVLVNGKLVSRGVPDRDAIRSAMLLELAATKSRENQPEDLS